MAYISQMEFNTIRELTGSAITGRAKFSTYAQQVDDPQLKQLFQQMANSCNQKINTFLGLL